MIIIMAHHRLAAQIANVSARVEHGSQVHLSEGQERIRSLALPSSKWS